MEPKFTKESELESGLTTRSVVPSNVMAIALLECFKGEGLAEAISEAVKKKQ
jgi:hypothetical protein